jgi:hypothetical protein
MNRLMLVAFGVLLSACRAVTRPPEPYSPDRLPAGDDVAILWSAGKIGLQLFEMQDCAVVAWRIKIPPGRHTVEVLNKETSVACMPSYLGLSCLVFE